MSKSIRIAVPSNAPGGMDSAMSSHFGHADCFTVIEIAEGKAVNLDVIANPPHETGGCMAPVLMLKEAGVNAIIVGSLGARPLAGFRQVGILVYTGISGTVRESVDAFLRNDLARSGEDIVCRHGNAHEHPGQENP